jgi:hypothetical protein
MIVMELVYVPHSLHYPLLHAKHWGIAQKAYSVVRSASLRH